MLRPATGLFAAGSALAATVWLLRRQIAIVTVSGESMQPSLAPGDRVLVRRARLSQLRRGLIVVVERPGPSGAWTTAAPSWPGTSRQWLIKRVAALPGDPWPPSALSDQAVPARNFAVLGDNSGSSYDSRSFGYCPEDRLLGIMIRPMRSSPAASRR
jgi:signal peptidase I